MRSLLLFFILFFLAFHAHAQLTIDTLDRKGKIWLSGGRDVGLSQEENRIGYFISDRLLVGTALEINQRDNFIAQPFLRYYFGKKLAQWRPYAEAYAGIDFKAEKFIINYGGKVGMERMLRPNSLLNIDLGYERSTEQTRNRFRLSAHLNTVLGGAFGKRAALNHFQKGTFTLEGQVAEISTLSLQNGSIGQVNITPKAGLFLSNRLMAKASLHLSYDLFDLSDEWSTRKVNAISAEAGIGLRYYFTTNRLFNFFGEADLSSRYLKSNVDFGNVSQKITSTRFKADIGLGASVFLNKSTSFDFGLKLSRQNDRDKKLGLDTFAKLNFWF